MRSEFTRTQRARREDVIAAAVVVIDREGYVAASIDKIAKEAGTSKGTVLYHFKTKDAVDQAVIDALYEAGAAYMRAEMLAVTGARARLHAYLASNLRFIAGHVAHVNAVHHILLGTGLTTDAFDPVTPLRDPLASGQAAGEFGAFDPLVVTLAIRAVVDGASFWFAAHPDLDVEHYIAEGIQIFDRATRP